jgi:hypothetical protein
LTHFLVVDKGAVASKLLCEIVGAHKVLECIYSPS